MGYRGCHGDHHGCHGEDAVVNTNEGCHRDTFSNRSSVSANLGREENFEIQIESQGNAGY